MCFKCFEVFYEVFEVFCEVFMKCFHNFSLGFRGVEVICPVCAFYNTKKEVGRTSAGLPPLPPACSQQTSFEHAALYWVPVCQTGSGSWWPHGTRFHTHAKVSTSTREEGMTSTTIRRFADPSIAPIGGWLKSCHAKKKQDARLGVANRQPEPCPVRSQYGF